MNLSKKQVLMIIAPENFRDEEYFEPKEILEKAGATITTASTAPEARSKAGKSIRVDLMLGELSDQDYDGLIFVGGSGAEIYFPMIKCHRLAQDMNDEGKIVGAICIAPTILAHAGLLQGQKATCFESQIDELKRNGATFTDEEVTITDDQLIITANGPQASSSFGQGFAKLLQG